MSSADTTDPASGKPTSSSNNVVRLCVPADAKFLKLARITAASLATRLGFNLDEIDDLRLALDELCFCLIPPAREDLDLESSEVPIDDDGGGTGGAQLELRYIVDDAAIAIEGEATIPAGAASKGSLRMQVNEFSEIILKSLVDEHELILETDRPWFRLMKRKREPAEFLEDATTWMTDSSGEAANQKDHT